MILRVATLIMCRIGRFTKTEKNKNTRAILMAIDFTISLVTGTKRFVVSYLCYIFTLLWA